MLQPVTRNSRGGPEGFSDNKAHIRLPVYDERVDRLIGVLIALDVLDVDPEEPVQSYTRPVRFVPTTKNISELMIELLKDHDVVTVVVDEFGGAVGLVTIGKIAFLS